MKKSFAGLLAAAVFALGVSQASAMEPKPHHKPHHHHGHSGFSFGIVIGDPYWNDPFWDVPVRPVVRGCSVERASQKAHRLGIRHQRIYKSPSVIKVVGTSHGDRVQVKFARAPGCPIIR